MHADSKDLARIRAVADYIYETVEREPGLYRHTEINGDGYKVFLLASLLPKMGFDVHIAKMAE